MFYAVVDEEGFEPFVIGSMLDPDYAADVMPGESMTRAEIRRRYPNALAAWERGNYTAYSVWRVVQEAEATVDLAAD